MSIPLEPIYQPKPGGRGPVIMSLPADLLTPVGAYMALSRKGPAFLLESVERGETLGRYSFLGTSPRGILSCRGGRSVYRDLARGREETLPQEDPLDALSRLMKRFGRSVPKIQGIPPFLGGAVGFFSYESVRYWERFPLPLKKDTGWPDALFMFSDLLVAFDHLAQKVYLVAWPRDGVPDALRKIQRAAKALARGVRLKRGTKKAPPTIRGIPSGTRFKKMVEQAKEQIAAGEIIQVVPSRRFEVEASLSPLPVYRALRSLNPSPYMFLLQFPGLALVGSSPETMVKVQNRHVEIHPIAGSRPRGRDSDEDEAFEKELQKDPKERAEHVMLVDLARNDLGKICTYGSVEVLDRMHVERFSHVMHLVSRVTGKLRPDKVPLDAIRAAFPAGTLTGAPKVRAMEIIHSLEPRRRGPYGGAVGYMDYNGKSLDTCITIRTISFQGRKATFQAGAGIVADSIPEKENQEVYFKSQAMKKALEMALSGRYGT